MSVDSDNETAPIPEEEGKPGQGQLSSDDANNNEETEEEAGGVEHVQTREARLDKRTAREELKKAMNRRR
jgi:hypothetical protein